LILELIGDTPNVPGAEIRKGLLAFGEAKTSPSFYQSMKRLEDAGYVTGQYEFSVARDSLDRDGCVREKTYCMTEEGHKVRNECLEFYQNRTK
jgi:DNA-binding PadR family transcriptional regulator